MSTPSRPPPRKSSTRKSTTDADFVPWLNRRGLYINLGDVASATSPEEKAECRLFPNAMFHDFCHFQWQNDVRAKRIMPSNETCRAVVLAVTHLQQPYLFGTRKVGHCARSTSQSRKNSSLFVQNSGLSARICASVSARSNHRTSESSLAWRRRECGSRSAS